MINLQKVKGRKKFVNENYVVQPKYDGIRAGIYWHKKKKGYVVQTRNGNILHGQNYIYIIFELKKCGLLTKDVGIDGELWAGDWNKTYSITAHKSTLPPSDLKDLKFVVFDILTDTDLSYCTRLGYIQEHMKYETNTLILPETHKVLSANDAERFALEWNKQDGIEGAVAKDLQAFYGKDNKWLKFKFFVTEDFRIICYHPIQRIIYLDVDGKKVSCKAELNDNQKAAVDEGKAHAEIQYQERTKTGSLRFPSLHRFRSDK